MLQVKPVAMPRPSAAKTNNPTKSKAMINRTRFGGTHSVVSLATAFLKSIFVQTTRALAKTNSAIFTKKKPLCK